MNHCDSPPLCSALPSLDENTEDMPEGRYRQDQERPSEPTDKLKGKHGNKSNSMIFIREMGKVYDLCPKTQLSRGGCISAVEHVVSMASD